MIFVDTGAWYASAVPDDPDFAAAQAWLRSNREPLITTDYVVDEILTLLMARGEFERCFDWGRQLLEERIARLEWVHPSDVHRAWILFSTHPDKHWSFTDCVSRAVIERLQIKTAFAFDNHFRQFGDLLVVPRV
jgi:predicted nucleic acid-binding protein